jgi:F5/8 type C domain-containing protein
MPTEFGPHDLTSATSHSPFVVSSSSNYTTLENFHAFDGASSTGHYWLGTGGGVDWLQLDCGSGITHLLGSYALQMDYVPEAARAPKNWTMLGSNDGSTWNTLDTRTNEINWNTANEVRTYTCATVTTAYRYFRLNVTANNGDATYTQVAELFLYLGTLPASIAVSPTSAAQGTSATLTVTGTNTNFVSGTTTVSFSGTGITVGTITVSSATSLTVAITIGSTASTGARTMTVTTGSEAPTASFTVTAAPTQRGNIAYNQIRTAARQGTGSKFQMFTGSAPTAGHIALYDANGNLIDGGAAPAGGSVTSVALSMPAEFTVAGSPVTSSGTLAVTKANETANTVWAGPSSGGAAAPAFRALVTADIPASSSISVNGTLVANVVNAPLLVNGVAIP